MLLIKNNITGAALLLVVACLGSGPSMAQNSAVNSATNVSAYPDGIIQFFEEPEGGGGGDGKLRCSLTFVSGVYSFRSDDTHNCKGLWGNITRVKVIGIPSASTFTLYEDVNCNARDDQAFMYTLKSVKNPTTTDLSIPIKSMVPTPVGQLLPGTTLRMEKNLSNRPPARVMGCVRIVRSAVPDSN